METFIKSLPSLKSIKDNFHFIAETDYPSFSHYLDNEERIYEEFRNASYLDAVKRSVELRNTSRLQKVVDAYPDAKGIISSKDGVELMMSLVPGDAGDVLQVLLATGVAVNGVNKLGYSPLHTACYHNSSECVKVLLQAGADPLLKERKFSQNALHIACSRQNSKCVEVLLEQYTGDISVYVQIPDRDGWKPLKHAASSMEITHLLKKIWCLSE